MVSTEGIKEILTMFKEILLEKIDIGDVDWAENTFGLSKNFTLPQIMIMSCKQGTRLDKIYYNQPIILSLYSFERCEGTTISYTQIAKETGDSLREAFNKIVKKL